MLAGGKTIYGGLNSEMTQYFGNHGHLCPTNYNPADFVLYLMQTADETTLDKLAIAWGKSAAGQSHAHAVHGRDPDFTVNDDRARRKHNHKTNKHNHTSSSRRPGFTTQFRMLLAREIRGTLRNKPALIARFGFVTFLGLFFAFIFQVRL